MTERADAASTRKRRMAEALRRNLWQRRLQKNLRSSRETEAFATADDGQGRTGVAESNVKRCRNDNA